MVWAESGKWRMAGEGGGGPQLDLPGQKMLGDKLSLGRLWNFASINNAHLQICLWSVVMMLGLLGILVSRLRLHTEVPLKELCSLQQVRLFKRCVSPSFALWLGQTLP